VSTAPGVGSSGLSLGNVSSIMYTRMQSYGVMSTRIYTTVGAYPTIAACSAAACTYGGAVKAMMTARTYGMSGACSLSDPTVALAQPSLARQGVRTDG
jgi:hypothetical protein